MGLWITGGHSFIRFKELRKSKIVQVKMPLFPNRANWNSLQRLRFQSSTNSRPNIKNQMKESWKRKKFLSNCNKRGWRNMIFRIWIENYMGISCIRRKSTSTQNRPNLVLLPFKQNPLSCLPLTKSNIAAKRTLLRALNSYFHPGWEIQGKKRWLRDSKQITPPCLFQTFVMCQKKKYYIENWREIIQVLRKI